MNSIDSSNFKNIYTEYYKKCFLFAKSYVHDDMAAEDIASEALIKLWEIGKSQDLGHPMPTLFVILKNKALDYLKHEAVKQKFIKSVTDWGKRELDIRISTLEAADPEKIFTKDIQKIIDDTISKLPEQTRAIFEMNRYQNLSKKEIAEIYGISVKGVDYHISKALGSLRENLKDYLPFSLLISFLTFF